MRWSAEARLIHPSCRLPEPEAASWIISLARPESTTKRTPSIVIEVCMLGGRGSEGGQDWKDGLKWLERLNRLKRLDWLKR